MTTKTYSLEEAADILRGGHEPADVQWLRKQLAKNRVTGFKAGRSWRMSQEDVDAAVVALRPRFVPVVPVVSGLTRTSARRLAS